MDKFIYIISFCLILGICPEMMAQTDSVSRSHPGTDKTLFTVVEKMPEFRGPGTIEQFISRHVKYPEAAIDNNITGTCRVSFVVDSTGKVTDVTVQKSSGSDLLDKEAMRVVKLMAFEPGMQKGKAIKVRLVQPITFALD